MIAEKTTLELGSVSAVGRASASSCLNPVFCRDRGVALIGWNRGTARVGMVDPGDAETLAALRFALGCEIASIAMTRDEVDLHNESERSYPRPTSTVPAPGPATLELLPVDRPEPSLVAVAGGRAIARMRGSTPLAPFERLLRAGIRLPEAGAVLVAAHATGQQLAPETLALAVEARDQGDLSLQAGRGDTPIPDWLVSALSSLPAGADAAPLLGRLLGIERNLGTRRSSLARLAVEIAVAGVLVAAIWWPLSIAASLAVAVVAATSLYWLAGGNPQFALVRIAILDIVGTLKGSGASSAAAIRIALERLRQDAPTWGRSPDTREELANALRLDPLTTAVLKHGALDVAARYASEICAEHEDNALATRQWIARMVAASAFCMAILLHLT